ncbi:lipopolysaccharide assembly protein LapA domain-containing protein [Oceanithermus sp.]
MRLVHWISFLAAALAVLLIVVVQLVDPAARVAVPGLGPVPLYWVLGAVFVLGFVAGWVYLPGYAWALARERRAWRREKAALQSELAKLRPAKIEEVPRIPDRPVEETASDA